MSGSSPHDRVVEPAQPADLFDPNDHSSILTPFWILLRVAGYFSALVLLYLLFRFSKGILQAFRNNRRDRQRQAWGLQDDFTYTRLLDNERYEDEDEGYHDADSSATKLPKLSLHKNLPDKPLPPIPEPESP
jgi:hypothetical protein